MSAQLHAVHLCGRRSSSCAADRTRSRPSAGDSGVFLFFACEQAEHGEPPPGQGPQTEGLEARG